MYYLALDPSLQCFGWVVFKGPDIVDYGTIQTKKLKGLSIYESLIIRTKLIANELKTIIHRYPIREIFTEHLIGSKSSSALRALSVCLGLVTGIAAGKGVAIRYVEPKDVKYTLTKDYTAPKEAVVAKASEMYPDIMKQIKTTNRKEAIADSIGVYFAALNGLYITGDL